MKRYRADPAQLMVDAGFVPDPWQARVLRSAAARVLMLSTRQGGKSTTSGFLALRETLFTPNTTVLVVSPSQRQSAELVRRVREAVNRLPGVVDLMGESVLADELSNRSRIIALPASEGNIRGYTAGMVILDEAARIGDDIVAAVRPMLATTGGKLLCLSTAFAKSGFFYEQWTGSEQWERVKVTASECPRSAAVPRGGARRALGERWFAMEYLCEFGDDIAAVFRTEDIHAARDFDLEPLFESARRVTEPTSEGPSISTGAIAPELEPLFRRS